MNKREAKGTLLIVQHLTARVATSWNSPGFFAVLESSWKSWHFVYKSLKISGRFSVLHRNRIVKLLSLIISTKKLGALKSEF